MTCTRKIALTDYAYVYNLVVVSPRLKSLCISNSIFIFGGSLLVPIYALFTADIGASVFMTGVLFAAKFLATAVADIIIMKLPHRFRDAVAVYQWSMFIRAVAWIYVGLNPSIPSLLIVQAVTGLAEGFGTPAFSLLMAGSIQEGKQLQQWALWDLIKNPVLAASGVMGGYIANEFGFSALFYSMGAIALIGVVIPVGQRGGRRRKARNFALASYQYFFSR